MLVVDVEGEVSAASMVRDSKLYIEIAKFVQAYNTIIRNPNEFLSEIGEELIDEDQDNLTWEQFVAIVSKCDLGFDPVPNDKQLAMYYSYAKQIGSIGGEVKVIATVKDVAEAQKRYYNFIDDTTTKIENQYNKQHQIAENRSKEIEELNNNVNKNRAINIAFFAGMCFSVFLLGLGFAGLFFNIPLVKVFGFGNRIVGGIILMVVGAVLFAVLDKFYIKTKYKYLKSKSDSDKLVSKSEKTIRDDLILKDKLDKYKKDLKIAKYELADKDKSFDVESCMEKLLAKNKFYLRLMGKDGQFYEDILNKDKLEKNMLDDMPFKSDFKSLIENILKGSKLGSDELSNAFLFGEGGLLDPNMIKMTMGEKGLKELREALGEERFADVTDSRDAFGNPNGDKSQKNRVEQEQIIRDTQEAIKQMNQNAANGITSNGSSTFDSVRKEQPSEDTRQTFREDSAPQDYRQTKINSDSNYDYQSGIDKFKKKTLTDAEAQQTADSENLTLTGEKPPKEQQFGNTGVSIREMDEIREYLGLTQKQLDEMPKEKLKQVIEEQGME